MFLKLAKRKSYYVMNLTQHPVRSDSPLVEKRKYEIS